MKLPSNDTHLEIEQEEDEDKPFFPDPNDPRNKAFENMSPCGRFCCWFLFFIGLFVIILDCLGLTGHPDVSQKQNDTTLEYSCPTVVEKSLNDVGDGMAWYLKDDAKHGNDSIQQLKNTSMDGWGIPYVTRKRLLRPWKERVFVNNIKRGDLIYESACGSGLNILITTEILREHDIYNLSIYGNAYVIESVALANRVWNSTSKAILGNICVGDSTNLSFVPSNAFDFVYTGYIDPLVDPLNLSSSSSSDKKLKKSIEYCFSNDTSKQELAAKEQQAQEDWYAMWISEMIRIAKPGKPIVTENNCESVCKHYFQHPEIHDWGGVDKEWWTGAISTYEWNVDPSSFLIQDEPTNEQWVFQRYHVLMRKNE